MKITLNHIYYSSWKKRLTTLRNQVDFEEKMLLTRLVRRDMTAFWQLWIQHQQNIYKHCHTSMDSNYENTEYAFNQVMLKVWNRLPEAAGKVTDLETWLISMTDDICNQICQEHQKKIAKSIENLKLGRDRESVEAQSDIRKLSQAALACREWEKFIYSTLDSLPSQQ
ncbi:MAG: hypothetical protein QNJ63_18420 [Calothrix sp. MO_192.B10]|nr:hypothetical protein [Calothrix sp. MO_192.B10]